jgi:AraC-like DNA-binding protein
METSKTCVFRQNISEEQFIAEHFFSYLVAGNLTVYDSEKEHKINAGDYVIAKRNHLGKYIKRYVNDEFKTVTIFLKQDFLKRFSNEYHLVAEESLSEGALVRLKPNPNLALFIQSVLPYIENPGPENERILELKRRELLLILLGDNPDLKNILFDFTDPGKIDLKAFMNRNFRFNVSLERFSYLTGRSLTTFKRDFRKIFNQSPGRWLVEKRLKEAHFLMHKKGQNPSSVYLEVGFEDLSHFSFAYKKLFGQNPSQIKKDSGK